MKILIFLIIIISSSLAQDLLQTNSIKKLTLNNAVEFATNNNPQLNKLREKIKIKKGEWFQSFGLNNPSISYLKEGINQSNTDLFGEQRWSLQQSIDFPLKSFYRLSKINFEETAEKENIKSYTLELKSDVKSKYVEVLYTKRLLGLREKQIELAKELKRIATAKLEAGEISELEIMKSDIQLAEANNYFEDAKQTFHKARYSLFQKIGLDPTVQSYDIQFDDSLHINEIDLNQDNLIDDLDNQPKVKSTTNLLYSTEYQIKESWSSLLPDINFSYYKQDYGNGYNFNGYEIGLNIPLWFMFNQNSSIQIAKANYRSAEWSLKEVKLSLKTDIENAWHGYEASREKIYRYTNNIRELADEFQSLTLIGYQMGELDLLRLVDAQQTYLNSEINYYNALKDYYLQIIQLEKYSGKELVY